jgi:hypothetical protein
VSIGGFEYEARVQAQSHVHWCIQQQTVPEGVSLELWAKDLPDLVAGLETGSLPELRQW